MAGATALGAVVHPHVGSGRTCWGIGFGCTPERDTDTLLIVAVYTAAAIATLVIAWWWSRRGRGAGGREGDRFPHARSGDALRDVEWAGPVTCRDAYGRSTGSRLEWANRDPRGAFGLGSGAITAIALGQWADRLRKRGVAVSIDDPGGDPAQYRRLRVGPSAGGVHSVPASAHL